MMLWLNFEQPGNTQLFKSAISKHPMHKKSFLNLLWHFHFPMQYNAMKET